MAHQLESTMFLPIGIDRVFSFFSDAANLARITPPAMGFEIVTPGPVAIRQGTEIDYRVRVFGVRIKWRSLISRWDPPHEFVDEQLQGPYKSWIHTHRFRASDGGTTIEDHVRYELRGWPLGELAYPLVRRQLDQIFAFRHTAIEQILRDVSPEA